MLVTPQGTILNPTPFTIFVKELDDEAEWGVRTLSKSADYPKLGGVADSLEGGAAMQMDLSIQEKWADRNLMKLNQEKSKVLPQGRNNPDAGHGPPGKQLGRKRPGMSWQRPRRT